MIGIQDYEAALDEIRGNIEVRRLMFIFMHVLLPAVVLAVADGVTGADYPPELRWLPANLLVLGGMLVVGCGVVVCAVLMRCHFGLVINGTKLDKVSKGELHLQGVNWLGVTFNFVLLTALSVAGGTLLFLQPLAGTLIAAGAALSLLVGTLMLFVLNHRRANALSERLAGHWEHAEIPPRLIERHAVMSLQDSNGDIAIVVTMAAALFAGFFGAMTKVGGIVDGLDLGVAAGDLRTHGVPVCAAYLFVATLLSARMVIRLRLAIAKHSDRLAELRGEPDDPWKFRILERTFLLYCLVLLFLAFSAVILGWHYGGATVGIALGSSCSIVGFLAYVLRLRSAGRAAAAKEKAARPPLADASPAGEAPVA